MAEAARGRPEAPPAHAPAPHQTGTLRRGHPMPSALLLALAVALSSSAAPSSAFTLSHGPRMLALRPRHPSSFAGTPFAAARSSSGRRRELGPTALFKWIKRKIRKDGEDPDEGGKGNEKLRWHSAITNEKGLGGTEEERAQAARMRRAALVAQDPTYTRRLRKDDVEGAQFIVPEQSPSPSSPSPPPPDAGSPPPPDAAEPGASARAQQHEMEAPPKVERQKKPGSKEAWYSSVPYTNLQRKLLDKKQDDGTLKDGGWGELVQEETPEQREEREARQQKLQEDAARTLGERAKYFSKDSQQQQQQQRAGTPIPGAGSRRVGSQSVQSPPPQPSSTQGTRPVPPRTGSRRSAEADGGSGLYKRTFQEAADKKLAKILGVDPSKIAAKGSSQAYLPRQRVASPPAFRPPPQPSQPLNNAAPYVSLRQPAQDEHENDKKMEGVQAGSDGEKDKGASKHEEGGEGDAGAGGAPATPLRSGPFAAFFPKARTPTVQRIESRDIPRLGNPPGAQHADGEDGGLVVDLDSLPVIGEVEDDMNGQTSQWKVIAREGLLVRAGPGDGEKPIARLKWMQGVDVDRETLPWVKLAEIDGWVRVSGGVRGREIFMVRQGKTLGFDGDEMEKKWGKPAG